MNCHQFELELDDYLDGRLEASRRQSMGEHLKRCAACGERLDEAHALLETLRMLPAPEAPAGLLDRALARVPSPERAPRAWPRWAIAPALAATLALGVAIGIFYTQEPGSPDVATVALQLEQPQTVQVMVRSPRELRATTIALTLPENVELVGRPGQRTLTWRADLREGANLLRLPLVAHGAPRGELVAQLSQGGASKALRVKLVLKPATGGVS
jgi:hypothetical protein